MITIIIIVIFRTSLHQNICQYKVVNFAELVAYNGFLKGQ